MLKKNVLHVYDINACSLIYYINDLEWYNILSEKFEIMLFKKDIINFADVINFNHFFLLYYHAVDEELKSRFISRVDLSLRSVLPFIKFAYGETILEKDFNHGYPMLMVPHHKTNKLIFSINDFSCYKLLQKWVLAFEFKYFNSMKLDNKEGLVVLTLRK